MHSSPPFYHLAWNKSHVRRGFSEATLFCRQLIEKTMEEFGKLDILVNNASQQVLSSRKTP